MNLESTILNLIDVQSVDLLTEWNTKLKPKLPSETNITLASICKSLKLKKSGKKDELVKRIISHVESSLKKTNIMDKLSTPVDVFLNNNNNFEVENTSLIVSPETKLVVGHEVRGQVENLTEEEVLQCQELRLNYDISKITPNTGLIYIPNEDDNSESEDDED